MNSITYAGYQRFLKSHLKTNEYGDRTLRDMAAVTDCSEPAHSPSDTGLTKVFISASELSEDTKITTKSSA